MNLLDRLTVFLFAHTPEAILVIFGYLSAFSGLWILSPWYHPGHAPALSNALASAWAMNIYAGILALIGLLIIVAVHKVNWPRRIPVMRVCAFITFLLYTYFALARILFFGMSNLQWTSIAACALVCGIVFIRLRGVE